MLFVTTVGHCDAPSKRAHGPLSPPRRRRRSSRESTRRRRGLLNRYYDPSSNQFLSIDPEVATTGQPYTYTGDDPLNSTDPLGLKQRCRPRTCSSPPKRHIGKPTVPDSVLASHPHKTTTRTSTVSSSNNYNAAPKSLTSTPGFSQGVKADQQDLFNGIDCHGSDNGIGGNGCDVQATEYSESISTTTFAFSSQSKIVQRTENITVSFSLITTSFASGLPEDSPGGSADFGISLGFKQYVGNAVVSTNSVNQSDLP